MFLNLNIKIFIIKKKENEAIQLKENFNQWYLNNPNKHHKMYWVGLEKFTLFEISLEIIANTKIGKRILKEIKKKGGIENVFDLQKEPYQCWPAIEEGIPG